MSIDATAVCHICPICRESFFTDRKVREHITDSNKGEHNKVNGFDMERTIETKLDRDWDESTEQEVHNKIIKAADYFDNISNEEVKTIADEADVHRYRVLRIFRDEGIDFTYPGRVPSSKFDDLSEKQQDALISWYTYPDDASHKEISQGKEYHRSYIQKTVNKYSWLFLSIYDGTDVLNQHTKDGEVSIENSSDELIETYSDMKENSDDENQGEQSFLEILDDMSIEYKIEIQEDEFEVIKKLIQNGYEDIAEKRFNN